MAGYSVQRIRGHDLATRTADRIVRIWADVFNYGTLPDKRKFRDDLFFIARDTSGRLGGVGCLTPVEVKFRKERYAIMGLKSITSQLRGKGFGRAVVEAMHDYLLAHDVTGGRFLQAVSHAVL